MLALFIGGVKSGKSRSAEEYVLKNSTQKPTYLATTEFIDEGMKKRIANHILQRGDNFTTVEEPINLVEVVKMNDGIFLVECMSMWVNNMLYYKKTLKDIEEELQMLNSLSKDIVFVINDVSRSVVSEYKSVREFVDVNGIVAQYLASTCREVYDHTAGISAKIK